LTRAAHMKLDSGCIGRTAARVNDLETSVHGI
jgi:hypothetical protein